MDLDLLNNFVAHGFLVDDLEKETDFYIRKLGYRVTRRGNSFVSLGGGPEGGMFLWAWDHISQHLGAPAEAIGHRAMQAIWLDSRQGVDDAYRYLKDKVHIIAPPQDWVWNAYAGYFLDNQQYLWEIWTWNK